MNQRSYLSKKWALVFFGVLGLCFILLAYPGSDYRARDAAELALRRKYGVPSSAITQWRFVHVKNSSGEETGAINGWGFFKQDGVRLKYRIYEVRDGWDFRVDECKAWNDDALESSDPAPDAPSLPAEPNPNHDPGVDGFNRMRGI